MKLIRFGEPGLEKPGLLLPTDARLNVTGFVRDYDEDFFAADGVARLAEWIHKKDGAVSCVSPRVRLGPPIARPTNSKLDRSA